MAQAAARAPSSRAVHDDGNLVPSTIHSLDPDRFHHPRECAGERGMRIGFIRVE
jgi:hypothetical protein